MYFRQYLKKWIQNSQAILNFLNNWILPFRQSTYWQLLGLNSTVQKHFEFTLTRKYKKFYQSIAMLFCAFLVEQQLYFIN